MFYNWKGAFVIPSTIRAGVQPARERQAHALISHQTDLGHNVCGLLEEAWMEQHGEYLKSCSLSSMLFDLRLDGIRMLVHDPEQRPSWLLAQGLLFVLLKRTQPAPSACIQAVAHDRGIHERELVRATARLRVLSLTTIGAGAIWWSLPPGFESALQLDAYDARWSTYRWR